jgi:Fe-S-cluster containining protein
MSSPVADDDRPVLDFELRIGERPMQIKTRLPAGEVRLVELLPVLRKFNDAIVGAAVEDVREAGRKVSCCAGCGACCRQIVPISEYEAISLLEWIDTLPEDQQALIRAKFAAALTDLDAKGMLERTRQAILAKNKEESLRFALEYFSARVACPFLVNESCGIYPIRPMKCREYLVTSPAENCVHPTAETIAMVELPASFSKILFHFEGAKTRAGSRWLPLVLLFEWGAQHRGDPPRKSDSVALFREFLAAFVDSTPEALEEMLTPGADAEATPDVTAPTVRSEGQDPSY